MSQAYFQNKFKLPSFENKIKEDALVTLHEESDILSHPFAKTLPTNYSQYD